MLLIIRSKLVIWLVRYGVTLAYKNKHHFKQKSAPGGRVAATKFAPRKGGELLLY